MESNKAQETFEKLNKHVQEAGEKMVKTMENIKDPAILAYLVAKNEFDQLVDEMLRLEMMAISNSLHKSIEEILNHLIKTEKDLLGRQG